ncbi:MAG: hypothetical protein GX633_03300, partial [Clostridiales bacterium]|nr:hypothetical protein [Clostridiales bacterium]
ADMILSIANIDVPNASNLPDNASLDLLTQFDLSNDLINPSKYLMWQDPLLGQFDYELTKCDFAKHFHTQGDKLRTYIGRYPHWDSCLRFYIALCGVLEDKCTIGVDIKAAYDANDCDKLMEIANDRIPKLVEKLDNMWKANRELWFERHKAYGWEVLERRYGCLTTRLNTAAYRLIQYCREETKEIEELKEPRLPFCHNDTGEILYYNDYLHTSTAWGR